MYNDYHMQDEDIQHKIEDPHPSHAVNIDEDDTVSDDDEDDDDDDDSEVDEPEED